MKQAITQYLMVALLIVGAYFIGVYKTETEYLKKGVPNTVAAVGQTPQLAQTTQQGSPTTVDVAKVQAKFDGKHITFGDPTAKLVITEVSDPSCPYCHVAGGLDPELDAQMGSQFKPVKDGGTYQPAVPEIKKLVDAGKASFLWIYAPGHGNGEVGTQTLYCAYEQGKFWEAHDILMSQTGYDLLNNTVKNDLSKSKMVTAALAKVLDGSKLQSCLDSKKYAGQPADDATFVQSLGFGATPTFFLNDKVVEGAASWDQAFKSIVDPLI
jgi:protein-disulfide isomerase